VGHEVCRRAAQDMTIKVDFDEFKRKNGFDLDLADLVILERGPHASEAVYYPKISEEHAQVDAILNEFILSGVDAVCAKITGPDRVFNRETGITTAIRSAAHKHAWHSLWKQAKNDLLSSCFRKQVYGGKYEMASEHNKTFSCSFGRLPILCQRVAPSLLHPRQPTYHHRLSCHCGTRKNAIENLGQYACQIWLKHNSFPYPRKSLFNCGKAENKMDVLK
jgi:hypothetical protein